MDQGDAEVGGLARGVDFDWIVVDEDFASAQMVTVTPDLVPSDETNQSVSYTLDPSITTIAEVAFNSSTGQVTITAKTNGYGNQNFTITATETENNNPNLENKTATQDFTQPDVNQLRFHSG